MGKQRTILSKMITKAAIVGCLGIAEGVLTTVRAKTIVSSGWRAYLRRGNKRRAPVSFMTWGMLRSERAWTIFLRVFGVASLIFGIFLLAFALTH